MPSPLTGSPFDVHPDGSFTVTVTIPRNASVGTIGNLLERDKVISSSFFFELRATIGGDRGNLRSGTYHLTQGMSYGDVLRILTTAPPAARVTNLTIVEGTGDAGQPEVRDRVRDRHPSELRGSRVGVGHLVDHCPSTSASVASTTALGWSMGTRCPQSATITWRPDVLVPLVILYEFGLILVKIGNKRKAKA